MGCVYMLQCSLRGRPVRCVHVAMFVEGEACEMCALVQCSWPEGDVDKLLSADDNRTHDFW